jgi:hypothetical protein
VVRITTTIIITVSYMHEPHKAIYLRRSVARPPASLTLVASNRRRPWIPSLASVGRLNCYWPSSARSFLASVSSRSMAKTFIPS